MVLHPSPSSQISICLSQHQQEILHGSLPDKIATSSVFQLPLVFREFFKNMLKLSIIFLAVS